MLLEECRSDSSSIQSLAAGINYYASTTKASQAAATAQHKQVSWDWLSSPQDKQPLKETLKSVRYQRECTSKAAYQIVEISKGILDELKGHKETMAEQCKLLKMIAGNQVELSKLLKGPVATGGKGPPQSGTAPTAPATPVPSGGAPPAPSAHAAPSASTEGGTSWKSSPNLGCLPMHLLHPRLPILHSFLLKLQAPSLAASGTTSQVGHQIMNQMSPEIPSKDAIAAGGGP